MVGGPNKPWRQRQPRVNPNKGKIRYNSHYSKKHKCYFRSGWERRFANLMDKARIKFEFEPRRFYFPKYKESYLPDFWIPKYKVWVEIKGILDRRDIDRMKLFTRAGHKLIMIRGSRLTKLEKGHISPKKLFTDPYYLQRFSNKDVSVEEIEAEEAD